MAAMLEPGERVRVKPWPSLTPAIHGAVLTVVRRTRGMPGWVDVRKEGPLRTTNYLMRAQALERIDVAAAAREEEDR